MGYKVTLGCPEDVMQSWEDMIIDEFLEKSAVKYTPS